MKTIILLILNFTFVYGVEKKDPRTINIALQTLFEFDNKKTSEDLALIERIQYFLEKLSNTIKKSNSRDDHRRFFFKETLEDILKEAINAILDLDDEILETIPDTLRREVNIYFEIISSDNRKFNSHRKIVMPAKVIRRQLNSFLVALENNNSKFAFLTSLDAKPAHKKLIDKLKKLKNYSNIRRRGTGIEEILRQGVRELYSNYYSNGNSKIKAFIRNVIANLFSKGEDTKKHTYAMKYRQKSSEYSGSSISESEDSEPVPEPKATTEKSLLQTLWVEEVGNREISESRENESTTKRPKKKKRNHKNFVKKQLIYDLNHDPNKPKRFKIESRKDASVKSRTIRKSVTHTSIMKSEEDSISLDEEHLKSRRNLSNSTSDPKQLTPTYTTTIIDTKLNKDVPIDDLLNNQNITENEITNITTMTVSSNITLEETTKESTKIEINNGTKRFIENITSTSTKQIN